MVAIAVSLYSKFMGLIFCFCSRFLGLVFGLGLACIFCKRLMQSRKRLFFEYVFNYSMNFRKNYGRVSFSTTASIGIGWWNRSLRTFICKLAWLWVLLLQFIKFWFKEKWSSTVVMFNRGKHALSIQWEVRFRLNNQGKESSKIPFLTYPCAVPGAGGS